MALKNIELFDLYVGKVFASLYNNFPMGVYLDAQNDVGGEMDEHELQVPKEWEIYQATIIWLYHL